MPKQPSETVKITVTVATHDDGVYRWFDVEVPATASEKRMVRLALMEAGLAWERPGGTYRAKD